MESFFLFTLIIKMAVTLIIAAINLQNYLQELYYRDVACIIYFEATGGLPPSGTNIKAAEFIQ